MQYIGVFLADMGYCAFESPWKGLWFGLEIHPAILELTVASVVNRLPIVVNDQGRDVDIILCEFIKCIKDLLVRQPLTQPVPRA